MRQAKNIEKIVKDNPNTKKELDKAIAEVIRLSNTISRLKKSNNEGDKTQTTSNASTDA